MPQEPAGAPVVVVGAGLSGLVAARTLRKAGIEVVVLEADTRLGGRALSETTALGSRVDLGGQWIGHDHHRLTALAAELGTTKYPMHTGTLPAVIAGSRQLSLADPAQLVTGGVLAAVEVLSRVGAPDRLNTVTLADALRRVPLSTARRLLEVTALISWTADPDRFSIKAMAAMLRRQGGVRTILTTRGGAQDSLLVEGIGTLVERIAAELGDRVRAGHRVTAITQDADGATVETTAGPVRAAKVIVTVPPPNLGRIDFDPPLPARRAALADTTTMGSVYKAIAVYDRPFWRDHGSAECLVLDPPGRAIFDSSPPDGPGHLVVLTAGPEARAMDDHTAEQRRTALLGVLADRFGPDLLTPVGWHEKAWHLDEFTGGGYISLPNPGTTEGIVPIDSTPFDHIHWAGTESADDHPGYFEGAIDAALRATTEVRTALAHRHP